MTAEFNKTVNKLIVQGWRVTSSNDKQYRLVKGNSEKVVTALSRGKVSVRDFVIRESYDFPVETDF